MNAGDVSIPLPDLSNHCFKSLQQQDEGWCLQGSRCTTCNRLCFPQKAVCPYCCANALQPMTLPKAGLLYAFTTVHVAATRTTPYQIGYVDIDPQVRVLAILRTADMPLHIGMSMQLQVAPTEMGAEWWFAPSGDTHV